MAAVLASDEGWKASCVACGELMCQKDTYAKTCKATVLRCEKVQAPPSKKKGKSKPKDAYDVVLSDTVLFPEGGGQPFDLGVIGDAAVTQVTNEDGVAVHRVSKPVAVGDEVNVEVTSAKQNKRFASRVGKNMLRDGSALKEHLHAK